MLTSLWRHSSIYFSKYTGPSKSTCCFQQLLLVAASCLWAETAKPCTSSLDFLNALAAFSKNGAFQWVMLCMLIAECVVCNTSATSIQQEKAPPLAAYSACKQKKQKWRHTLSSLPPAVPFRTPLLFLLSFAGSSKVFSNVLTVLVCGDKCMFFKPWFNETTLVMVIKIFDPSLASYANICMIAYTIYIHLGLIRISFPEEKCIYERQTKISKKAMCLFE